MKLPKKFMDLAGQRYGRLRVLAFAGRRNGFTYWNVECDCGNVKAVKAMLMRSQHTQSCGCLHKDGVRMLKWAHGCAREGRAFPEYTIWLGIRRRCNSPKTVEYPNYGGRGIKLCKGFNAFPNFLAVIGRRPSNKHSIDRIDNDGSYACGECKQCRDKGWKLNVRWATRIVQCNNKRDNVYVEINGVKKTVSEWARINGIPPSRAHSRMRTGWSATEAVTVREQAFKRGGKLRSVNVNPRSRVFSFRGESNKMSEWARRLGMTPASLSERIEKHGVAKALGTPKGVRIK